MKLSIIVPTRNGERYIEETIRSITDQLYYSVEIIVSINKSKDNTKEVVKKIKDERVRVIEPPYSLSMTKHYEFCISQAVGEWVTIIGDDDGLISNFFENFEKIIAYDDKTDVIMTNRCHYFWEGIRGEKRVLVYNNKNIKRKLNKYSIIFQSLIGMKSHLDLPKMYTGNIIKRELIEEIKLKSNGNF